MITPAVVGNLLVNSGHVCMLYTLVYWNVQRRSEPLRRNGSVQSLACPSCEPVVHHLSDGVLSYPIFVKLSKSWGCLILEDRLPTLLRDALKHMIRTRNRAVSLTSTITSRHPAGANHPLP
jgi:hypothetical protein